ncbi:RsmB/NOP family class I SAM-dependent RNA methyltransferase [Actinophytocola sediminis]
MTQQGRRQERFSRPRSPHPPKRRSGPSRPPVEDPARQAALDTLREVRLRDAYANLLLPQLLRERRITGRDAALATELAYGACRSIGLLDEILDACIDRPLAKVEPGLLDVLRLGTYQLLRTRIPPHAAVASTVDLVRGEQGSRQTGFVNAVLRKVSELDEDAWMARLAPDPATDPIGNVAMRCAHPRWVARAFADALGTTGDELKTALDADNERPAVHLVARPGEVTAEELAAMTGGEVAPYSPYGVRLAAGAGDPAGLEPVRERLASVQDEGSQLCAIAMTRPEIEGTDERWLDLCAGPGGKSALLAAVLGISGGRLDAVEKAPHRARLVERSTEGLPVTVHTGDGRQPAALGLAAGTFDRVLVDAPCTGLGSLRRRPESRWRRRPSDVGELTKLQRELLLTAIDLVRPGGVVGYVVCTPHLSETIGVVADVVRRTGATTLDARESFPEMPDLGQGPHVQLWPHRHGTDAMFCALLRK